MQVNEKTRIINGPVFGEQVTNENDAIPKIAPSQKRQLWHIISQFQTHEIENFWQLAFGTVKISAENDGLWDTFPMCKN